MLIAGYAQEVSSRRKDWRNRTHVDHSLTCCSEKNSQSPRLAERSWRRPATSATGTHNSARYFRAKPCRDLYTVMHSLKMTRWGTSSQWRSWWRMWLRPLSNFRVPLMTRGMALGGGGPPEQVCGHSYGLPARRRPGQHQQGRSVQGWRRGHRHEARPQAITWWSRRRRRYGGVIIMFYYAIMVARHTVQYTHLQSYTQIHPLKHEKRF